MPEYLTPGVYIEETSFRSKSIEGVGTSTAAFVGPTRRGPVASADETPELITSFADFQRIYGGFGDLTFGGTAGPNFLAHGVKAFFDNGGARLYVGRVVGANAGTASNAVTGEVTIRARVRGAGGNATLEVAEDAAPATRATAAAAAAGAVLRMQPDGGNAEYFVKVGDEWRAADDSPLDVARFANETADLISLTIVVRDADGNAQDFDDLALHPALPRWVGRVLQENPGKRADALQNLVWFDAGGADDLTPAQVLALRAALVTGTPRAGEGRLALTGGTDGDAPTSANYVPALAAVEKLSDVSIVAAPGSSASAQADAIRAELLTHVGRHPRYRILVLDTAPNLTPNGARAAKAAIDSSYAALYYPWVVVSDPLAAGDRSRDAELAVPPSGAVCGIYARTDVDRGVHKAPANEIVRGALRFERDVNFAEQGILNPIGVNCLRFFPGRGLRVWGARTTTSDPEWKYVNVRRYFIYLEASIDRGTQWVVFEPNGERLWANVRETISSFLYNEWRNGALLGSSPKEAFFVRCDRTTMTQNDLDNGRLVCEVGVAPLRPAEFVIFRIGQKTADAGS